MDDDRLRELAASGGTLSAIAAALGCDRATVRRHLRRLGLQTAHMARRRALAEARRAGRDTTLAHCDRHGVTTFKLRDDGTSFRCLQCRSADVSNSRRRRKEQLVREAGGRCQICGYDTYMGALQFHHLNPAMKRFGVSHRGIPRALDVAREEIRGCILLCANCHAETEAGVNKLPNMGA